jgi:Cu/Ag efflux protein CusF
MFFLFAGSLCVGLALGEASQAATQEPPFPPIQGEARRGPGQWQRGQGTAGTITEIKNDEMTIRLSSGDLAHIKLTDNTRYVRNREPAKLSDFKVGDAVVVRGERAGENTWTAHLVASRSEGMPPSREGLGKEFIAGEVKAIEGVKLTILRIDGETQTIQVDENTSFRKQGESITLADIKVGDRVFGRGQLKEGVFFPLMLNVGEFRQPRRMPGGPPQP